MSESVISILAAYEPSAAHKDNGSIPEALTNFSKIKLSTEKQGDGTVLDHLLVMERGSTDLSDVMSHGDLAGRNMLHVRSISSSTAKCLQEMNGKGVTHGDVKSRNFVLVLITSKHAAIDLDAAASINLDDRPPGQACAY